MAKQTSEWMTRLVEKYRIPSEKSKPIKILTEEQLFIEIRWSKQC